MTTDVAIVGGGPAGAWTAYRLARAGARVTIFDASHPREKACGGGITGRALALVAEAIDRRLLPCTVVRAARFAEATIPLDGDALVVASRTAFDAALLDAAVAAGARLARARVVDIHADARGVTIDSADGRCVADVVIGADGANSLVRRRVAAPFRRDQLSIATGYFVRGVTSDEIAIEFTASPAGYLWSFPRPDHLAIGICAQADTGAQAATLRARAHDWIRARGWVASSSSCPDRRLVPYSWPIPSLSTRDFDTLPLAGPRWFLVGDAAGLVDPITREGIFFALASAAACASALGRTESARAYAAQVQAECGAELRRAARLKAGFYKPAFIGLTMRALAQSAAIRAVMADLIAGRQSYRRLKWRLIKTLEIRLALQALSG